MLDGVTINARFIGDEGVTGLDRTLTYTVNVMEYGGNYYVTQARSIFFEQDNRFSMVYSSRNAMKKDWKFENIV